MLSARPSRWTCSGRSPTRLFSSRCSAWTAVRPYSTARYARKAFTILLNTAGVVKLVVERDEPYDPMNIRRYSPGTVVAGAHGPFYLRKQIDPGMIFRTSPVHVIISVTLQCCKKGFDDNVFY